MEESHHFTLVATYEKKGVYFTAVPHKWASKKILSWPQHLRQKEREVLRSDPSSVPESNWAQFPCIIKFKNIESFKKALELEKQFTECSDTEAEEQLLQSSNEKNSDRNYMFENKFPTIEEEEEEEDITNAESLMLPLQSSSTTPPIYFVNSQENPDDNICQEINSIKEDIKELKCEIKSNYSKIMTYLDKIYFEISSKNAQTSKEINEEKHLIEEIKFPLKNHNEVLQLESQINQNPQFKGQLIDVLSTIGGKSGQEDGARIGYKVVDFFFVPTLLLDYSWTGLSRDKTQEKKSFRALDGILDVFFQVINLADSRHTKEKNSNLFKDGVLKHAKKRCQRKRCHQQYSKDEPTEDIEQENTNEEVAGLSNVGKLTDLAETDN